MFSLFLHSASSTKWAILYAGSNTWYNYRHQADVSTLYTMLVARGFDDEHIIQCSYDDVATCADNPYQGQLFHDLDHINIYPGASKVDYSGSSVTAETFYNVLTTIPSTSEDNVFIYYDNHGGTGILGVPEGNGDYIYANDLNTALRQMYNDGHYKYCLFGVEACYSGSVACKLDAPNMAIITAANDHESSYSYMYDFDLANCLTNEFTYYFVGFMDEYPDETIGGLFEYTSECVQGSHVCYYGDESMKSLKVADFYGTTNKIVKHPKLNKANLIPQWLVTKSVLKSAADSSADPVRQTAARKQLRKLIAAQNKLTSTLETIVRFLSPLSVQSILAEKVTEPTDEYFEVLKYFTSKYGTVPGDYLPKLSVFVTLSKLFSVKDIKAAIDAVC